MTEVISIHKALILEARSDIEIYATNRVSSPLNKLPNFLKWKTNWDELASRYHKIPIYKLASFVNFDYSIEYKFKEEGEQGAVSWVYMYGKTRAGREQLDRSFTKGKYVYVLTNIAYPGVCKIGKAVNPQERIKQINNAGVVSEWELKYALPVTDDFLVENLVHQELATLRLSSHQGSSREFFSVSLEEAISAIEKIGYNFSTNPPIYY
jgi:hypothetical protein